MKTNHTPGPWEHRLEDDHSIAIIDHSGKDVATVWPSCAYGYTPTAEQAAEAEANARLFAAAPDLLEALEIAETALLFNHPDEGHEGLMYCKCRYAVAYRKVIAAIAKAKGE